MLADYQHSGLKVVEICETHQVLASTLSAWVGEAGIPRRRRGRRRLGEPPPRARAILAYAVAHGFSEAARHLNVSKQYVSSLGKRWDIASPETKSKVSATRSAPAVTRCLTNTRKETVISFRLRRCQLAALLASFGPSFTESTSSVHKLMRAALLERIEPREKP